MPYELEDAARSIVDMPVGSVEYMSIMANDSNEVIGAVYKYSRRVRVEVSKIGPIEFRVERIR